MLCVSFEQTLESMKTEDGTDKTALAISSPVTVGIQPALQLFREHMWRLHSL